MSEYNEFKNCNICPKKFFTKTGLKLHLDEVHEKQLSSEETGNQVKATEMNSAVECVSLKSRIGNNNKRESDTLEEIEKNVETKEIQVGRKMYYLSA